MAPFQNWHHSANERIKKQPISFLLLEAIIALVLIGVITLQGYKGYQKLIARSELNQSVADKLNEGDL